jgi:S-(hydroxymethyl)glutathione dehydrogenase / alcohol dehydrogenase
LNKFLESSSRKGSNIPEVDQMRGAVVTEMRKPVEIWDDLELRAPGAGEVLVAMRAAGVCHSDLSMQNGTWQTVGPIVLGHEGAGEVLATGPGVTTVAAGDHVILSWIPPCGQCRLCLGGQPQLCHAVRDARAGQPPALQGRGSAVKSAMGVGAFAEQTVVPVQAVVPIDPDVPFDVAALVGCGVMTGVGAAINTAKVRPGSTVAVIGCGGVGLSVIQGARLAGAAVIAAVDRFESKLELARRFGATHAVRDTELAGALPGLTDGLGFDYAFEAVGRSQTIRAAWDATRRGGTTVVVGVGSGADKVEFGAGELSLSERKLLGCLYGSADVRTDFARLLRLWRAGQLDLTGLVSRHVALDEVNDAFAAMEAGEVARSVIRF